MNAGRHGLGHAAAFASAADERVDVLGAPVRAEPAHTRRELELDATATGSG